jgi:hypothetical protein
LKQDLKVLHGRLEGGDADSHVLAGLIAHLGVVGVLQSRGPVRVGETVRRGLSKRSGRDNNGQVGMS